MTKEQCLKRAAECNRLAEAASDPDMKLYLMKLALTWMQSATEADGKERAKSLRLPIGQSTFHRDRAAVQPER